MTTDIKTITPAALLQMAVDKGADIGVITKLLELNTEWERQHAREAFFMALAKFQATCPAVPKSKSGYDNRYQYAPLDAIVAAIRQTLQECFLSYRWEQSEDGENISVTTILSHVGGHEERNTLSAKADTSGSKNAIQARGSAVSYLRRYTLESALGIATSTTDDDGGTGCAIDEEEVAKIVEMLNVTKSNHTKFCEMFKIAEIADLSKKDFDKAVRLLNQKSKAMPDPNAPKKGRGE